MPSYPRPMNSSNSQFSCIILAGGEGKRVGGRDKGLIRYRDKTLIQHVIETVEPQTDEIIISANRNIETYETYGYKVVSDTTEQLQGPLAGIAAALPHCKNDWVLITPCDMPFLPSDLIAKLSVDMANSHLHIASVNDRLQLTLLVNKSLLSSIIESLQNGQLRIMQWATSQNPMIHQFSNSQNFKNFNDTKDL